MYYATLSDIHGNFAALKAVEADARDLAERDGMPLSFLCLGDCVDYGPQPVECVEWVAQHVTTPVIGNHDRAAISDQLPLAIDERYWPMLLWTRQALSGQARAIIAGWPETAVVGPFTLFHSSLADRDTYITGPEAARASLQRLPATAPYGLHGHTHIACVFTQNHARLLLGLACPSGAALHNTSAAVYALDEWHNLLGGGERALLNPGSVGQPRHHALLVGAGVAADGAASYALLREDSQGRWQVRFRRVPYDVERTAGLLEGLTWSGGPAPSLGDHPLERRLKAVYAVMSEALPTTATRLAALLRV